MRVSMKYAVAILVGSLGMTSFSLGVTTPASADDEQRYLVIAGGALPANLDALISSVGGQLVTSFNQIGVAVVASSEPSFIAAAESLPGIQAVVKDPVTALSLPAGEEGVVAEAVDEAIFADASGTGGPAINALQWNLNVIQAKQAWLEGYLGQGVVVAVLDSGIDDGHPALMGQVIRSLSKSFVNEIASPMDPFIDRAAHGTHVAGVIAAKSGLPGVAPAAKLVSIKVVKWDNALRAGVGLESDVIAGILYAADLGVVDIINLSLGFTFLVDGREGAQLLAALNRAVNYATSKGVLVVASIGNGGSNLDRNRNAVKAPAQITHVVAVSATGPLFGVDPDQFPFYSDYGFSTVFVAAPGGNLQLDANGKRITPATDFVLSICSRQAVLAPACARAPMGLFMAGTSQAAAHVSGVAALIDSKFGGALNAAQLRSALQRSADDRGMPGKDAKYGYGRINAHSAVAK